MNVFDYFTHVLGKKPELSAKLEVEDNNPNGSIRNLDINDPCGIDCRRAIDAARTYIDTTGVSIYDDNSISKVMIDPVRASCNEVIEMFWRG